MDDTARRTHEIEAVRESLTRHLIQFVVDQVNRTRVRRDNAVLEFHTPREIEHACAGVGGNGALGRYHRAEHVEDPATVGWTGPGRAGAATREVAAHRAAQHIHATIVI